MWKRLEGAPEKVREQRVVFYQTLESLMDENPKVVALEADLGGASGSLRIKKSHPDNFIECGIMEANMIGVAAGMSMRGFVPFVHSFSPFASRRVADQIFLAGAYSHNTLNIYASDPGVCAATNGGTHTSFEDVSLMRAIPGVEIYDPADGVQLEWLIRTLAGRSGVHYIRTTRKDILPIYAPGSTFELGKGNVLRAGSDVLMLAAGTVLEDALGAAEALEGAGISVEVADMFSLKPLDSALVLREAAGKRLVVTVENHSVTGGLGSAVAEPLAEQGAHAPLLRVGVREQFGQVGSLKYLKRAYGLDAPSIADAVRAALEK